MYNLEGSDSPNEFVEIHNLSATDTVDLRGWTIRDKYSVDTLEDSGTGSKIPPGAYGLIVEGDYPLDNGIYSDIIPAGTMIMKVDDSSIGNGLSSSDSLYLINSDGQIVDSLGWTDIANPSFSIERVRLHKPNIPSNWKASQDFLGTPGISNSVQPLNVDGYLLSDSLNLSRTLLGKTDLTTLSGIVVNVGLQSFSGEIFITEENSTLANINIDPLNELDTAFFSVELGPFATSGKHKLTVFLQLSGDEDTTNNSGMVELAVQYDWNTLVLNEFMAMPNNDQTEFIELIANTDFILEDWSISDNTRKLKRLPVFSVAANDFIIIAPDITLFPGRPVNVHFIVPLSSFPILNNSGDAIYIYDMTGFIVDSLVYDNTWPVAPEVSTEKLRPEFPANNSKNWKTAVDSEGMTPGLDNSVLLFDVDGSLIQDSVHHIPQFPQPDEEITLVIALANAGVSPYAGHITVEENSLELERYTTPIVNAGDTLTLNLRLSGLPSGIHQLDIRLFSDSDPNTQNDVVYDTVKVSYPFGTVILNEFMAQPDSAQTEFIELTGTLPLTMQGWAVSDNSKIRKVFPQVDISAGSFLVIAADSSLVEITPATSPYLVPPTGFPGLNNDADAIYLFDMTGEIIDSLLYNKNWPLMAGRSTEKFRPEYESNDSSRWGLSVDERAATPGASNSIYYATIPEEGSMIFDPNPFSPDGDGWDDILFMKYKLPFEQASLKIQIFDITGRTIATPYWNTAVSQEGVLTWDGRRNNGDPARIGIYIVKVTARDISSGRTWEDAHTVVLAKPLK